MIKKKIFRLIRDLDKELHQHILPYWTDRMADPETRGFHGRIDGHNKLHEDADRGSVLNARILWTYSAAFNASHEEEYLKMANLAYDYCMKYFVRGDQKGVYWLVDRNGKPVDTKNQIYALAFMIYALAEYYQATGFYHAVEAAVNLYRAIEEHSYDPDHGGYFEAFDENWNLLEDLRLSDKDANEKKTMNTHLHILEAYTNLYREWDDPGLLERLRALVRVFMDRIVDPETHHFRLFFDEKWACKGRLISFGHDIEGSWLLYEAALVSNDPDLIRQTGELVPRIVDAVLEKGLDPEYGGIYYESDPDAGIDTDKHWWPQVEAMVGLVNAWQLTGKKTYLDHAYEIWQFTRQYVIDKKHGEWHYRLSRKGKPFHDQDKAGFWKCPYHNSRACLEIIQRLRTEV